jgi:phosphoglycerol geranylgeranyltransferase
MIYKSILDSSGRKKMLALLIDPDETGIDRIPGLIGQANDSGISLVLVGGSLVNKPVDQLVAAIKDHSFAPVLLFPGNPGQLSDKADGLLLLSLISGRNPEFLIGNHVIAAQFIKNSSLEVIPVGYMLVENGSISSVEYMSNTKPLPRDKPGIAVSTALAGEMLGLKLIYMEGGSGARDIIPPGTISEVKKNISIPLIVGGGIKSAEDLRKVFDAGADIAVVGNAAERDAGILKEFSMLS